MTELAKPAVMLWIRASFVAFSNGTLLVHSVFQAVTAETPLQLPGAPWWWHRTAALTGGAVIILTSFLPWFSFLFYVVFFNCCVGTGFCLFVLNFCFGQLLKEQNENVTGCVSLLYQSSLGFWYSSGNCLHTENNKKISVLIVSLAFLRSPCLLTNQYY